MSYQEKDKKKITSGETNLQRNMGKLLPQILILGGTKWVESEGKCFQQEKSQNAEGTETAKS